MPSNPTPNNQIVWLASYPKSGNTWLRFMLYAALQGTPKLSIDINRKIRDIHRPMPTNSPANQTNPNYIKTHFELTNQHPQLDQTLKAIHIIRNPKDVLLSALNYHRLNGLTPDQLPAKIYAKQFIAQAGDPHFKNAGFGTWTSHARSWTNTTRFPVLHLRYEDLKANPIAQLTKMLDFLETKKTPDQIAAAVKASSFDAMRALEIREKQTDKSNDLTKRLFVGSNDATRKGIYFMNAGKTNQSLNHLAPTLDTHFNTTLKTDLAEFGY